MPMTRALNHCTRLLLAVALLFCERTICRAADAQVFRFHHEAVIGTSLDLQVTRRMRSRAAVEAAILAEIERLRKILSTYDPASEISQVNARHAPVACSPELLEVLGFYDFWTANLEALTMGTSAS